MSLERRRAERMSSMTISTRSHMLRPSPGRSLAEFNLLGLAEGSFVRRARTEPSDVQVLYSNPFLTRSLACARRFATCLDKSSFTYIISFLGVSGSLSIFLLYKILSLSNPETNWRISGRGLFLSLVGILYALLMSF